MQRSCKRYLCKHSFVLS